MTNPGELSSQWLSGPVIGPGDVTTDDLVLVIQPGGTWATIPPEVLVTLPDPPDPGPDPPDPIPGTVVSSTSALLSALQALEDAGTGGTIQCTPSSFDFAYIRNMVFTSQVTIIAQNSNNRPVFAGIEVRDCANLKLEMLNANPAVDSKYAFELANSSNITFLACKGFGLDSPYTDLAVGFFLRNFVNAVVENCEAEKVQHGISFINGAQSGVGNLPNCGPLLIRGCDVHNVRTDCIRGGGVSNLTIERNRCYRFFPASGDHPDGIQIWTTNTIEQTVNVNINNNLINRADGTGIAPQGVFVRDQIGKGYDNLSVTENAALGCLHNGVCVTGDSDAADQMTDITMSENYVEGWVDQRSNLRADYISTGLWADNTATNYTVVNNGPGFVDGGGNVEISEDTAIGDYTRFNVWVAGHPNVPLP